MIPALLLAMALSSAAVPAQPATADERRSLSGISGVDVVVEQLDPTALADGLTTDQLKTEAQLKLGAAGIKVSTRYESYLDIEVIYLTVNDKSENLNLGFVASIMVSLKQLANLARHKEISTWARTWQRKGLIYGPPGQGREAVKNGVGNLVSQFIGDYLPANPKP